MFLVRIEPCDLYQFMPNFIVYKKNLLVLTRFNLRLDRSQSKKEKKTFERKFQIQAQNNVTRISTKMLIRL